MLGFWQGKFVNLRCESIKKGKVHFHWKNIDLVFEIACFTRFKKNSHFPSWVHFIPNLVLKLWEGICKFITMWMLKLILSADKIFPNMKTYLDPQMWIGWSSFCLCKAFLDNQIQSINCIVNKSPRFWEHAVRGHCNGPWFWLDSDRDWLDSDCVSLCDATSWENVKDPSRRILNLRRTYQNMKISWNIRILISPSINSYSNFSLSTSKPWFLTHQNPCMFGGKIKHILLHTHSLDLLFI